MKRRLNFTGRKRIPRNMIDCFVSTNSGGGSEFKVDVDLSGLNLPGNAQVFIEAYYRSSVMRYDLGKVDSLQTPFTSRLDEIQSDIIFFRVKVVDQADGVGRILAIADGISPGTDAPRSSLLPVTKQDLRDRIWRLSFDGPSPVLEVNNQYRSNIAIDEIVRTEPAFLTLVLPAVLREVLTQILVINEYDELDGDDWQSQWLQFASSFPAVEPLGNLPGDPRKNLGEYVDWIEEAVNSFCRHHGVKREFENWAAELQ
ncbi:MAG: hypothetical protein ACC700_18850 [Anaerolineales bacterium]